MRITVYDMDYIHKTSFKPNVTCMKLVSYHRQKEDIVNFVQTLDDLKYEHDIMYVVRENKRSPFPTSRIIDSPKVRLIGKEFKYYPNFYNTPPEVAMVRPDYDIYHYLEKNKYSNAHMIQLLYGHTKLPMKQNYENAVAKGRKMFVVTDENLWKIKKETLLECLEELNGLKNIVFYSPISLKRILGDNEIKELFLKLKLMPGIVQPFKNDYGSEIDSVYQIIDFAAELKQNNPAVLIRGFPVKAVLLDHWEDSKNAIKDLERCLKIVDYAKSKEVSVLIKSASYRLLSPYWVFFETLETWTAYHPYSSYFEAMMHGAISRYNMPWDAILNNPRKWITPRLEFLLHLIIKYPNLVFKYGTRKWKDKFLDLSLIDVNKLKKYANHYEQEEVMRRLEEEIKR